MKDNKKLIILIPSYEPDEKLIKLVDELLKEKIETIVVDDGSGKKYKNIFSKLKTKVISYDVNKGKGYALKTGFEYIDKNYKNFIIVTVDSDGQHKIKDAKKLYNYVLENKNTLALGMRKRTKKVPLRSRIGNSITRFVYYISTGIHIYDTQTGLRAFSNELIDYMLKIPGDRFEYEMNMLLYASKNNINIHEIEIETIYFKDNNKKSHFDTVKDSYKVYKEIFKFSGASFISFLIDYILYSLLLIISNNLIFSNIGARIISASCNYTMNRKLVFNSKKSLSKTLFKYILLALVIILLNTIILFLLSQYINPFISKIITEIILFILSFIIQKKYIF